MPVNWEQQRYLTMFDLAKRMDPNGKVPRIVERMITNEILNDMVTIEGNLPNGHVTTIRTGLPETSWKTLYKGTPASKSQTTQVTDTCGILETYSKVDEDVITLNGNMEAFRLSEAQPHIDAMNEAMARALFYANTAKDPNQPRGLAMRYNTTSPMVSISRNVIDAGGTDADDLTSMWLLCWGENTIHAFYPKGSQLGIEHKDHGLQEQHWHDPDGQLPDHTYYAYVDQWKWKIGFCVRDWRYGVRICNIPWKKLDDPTICTKLLNCMIDAEETIRSMSAGRPAWYMNKAVKAALRKGILGINKVERTFDTVTGHSIDRWNGVPIRQVDVLEVAEKQVKAIA